MSSFLRPRELIHPPPPFFACLHSQKARYYINLSLYVGSLLATSCCALGVAVFLTLIGKVRAPSSPTSPFFRPSLSG